MKPPDHLGTAAVAKWAEIVPTLGTTDPGTADALAAYCVAYSRWVEAERQVAALGLVVKSPAGFPVDNPYLGIGKRALIEMHRWGKELGIVTHTAKTQTTTPAKMATRRNAPSNPLANIRLRVTG